jgi:hypothetical protein
LPYLQAEVELLAEGDAENLPELSAGLKQLWQEAHELAVGEELAPARDPAFGAFSYFIAATLPLDLETRQAILQAETERTRLALLEDRLREWLPRLRRVARVKKKAAGNGHG